MSSAYHRPENIPIPVSSFDPESLRKLAQTYNGLLEEDVVTVGGDFVPELIERSQLVVEKIENGIGTTATAETIQMGLVVLDESERVVLESARRIQTPRRFI